MKKAVLALCVLLLLAGCSSSQKTAPHKAEKPQEQANPKIAAPADIRYPKSPSIEDYDAQIAISDKNPVDGTVLSGYADFSQESFSAILKTASDNVSYSPLSLYYPLMLTLQASEGETAKQLQMLLHVNRRDNAKNMGNLYRRLYTDNEGGQLKIANSLWIQNAYPVKNDFIKTANKQFYAAAYDVDFSQSKTADLMAAWIREHTNGNLSPSIETDASMRMAILNAIYYKARFATVFDKKDTTKDTFYTQDGKVATDFMHQIMDSHFFIDNKDYAATSLALNNSSSLTLVLPKEGKDIRQLMEQKGFLQELLEDDSEGAAFGIMNLSLPKFKIHSKLLLADTLKAMGVTALFDTAAELEGITDEKPLFVSNIQQETSIALDEEGIEASAYTEMGMVGAANIKNPKTLNLNLNREFLYVISTRLDGRELPLFIGVCTDPAS